MPARARLAMLAAATLVLLGALAIVVFGPSADPDGGSGYRGAIRPDIPPQDFVLEDQDGARVDLGELRGDVVVLAFLYTTCQDECPVVASQIRGALDDLGRDVPVLAVSVDPAGDTPARAKRFLVRQRLVGRMRFLLGDRATLQPVWQAYGVRPQGEGFEHTAPVVLLDRAGRQRIGFPTDKLTPEGLAHDIARLAAGT